MFELPFYLLMQAPYSLITMRCRASVARNNKEGIMTLSIERGKVKGLSF
jgi:hypothetical protein